MNRAKRNFEGNDDEQPERKRPALASVIVEALKVDSLQKICSSLEPILRRVVSEEVERALSKIGPARITGSLQLHFRSKLSLPLFTGGRVEGEQGAAIHVILIDANSGHAITFGPEASAKLDVVVLEGDFNNEDWTQEEFESHIVKEREGKRPLLAGDLQVTLKEGVGTFSELIFTDNSSWIRSRKFRLGLKVASGYCEGIRIREAKTEAFTVKDHRGELYKKHYPPALHDQVWRLEKIGKDGAFHKKLNAAGIITVEDFLRCLVRDSANLRSILGSGMSNKMWDALVEHAKTCLLCGKLYIFYADVSSNVGVVFNNIYELSGLISGDQYLSADSLADTQKVYVDGLVKKAYENWNHVIEYDGKSLMNFKQPKNLAMAPTNYSTTIDHSMQFLANQTSVQSELAIGGFNQSLATQRQLLNSNARAQFEFAQDELMDNVDETERDQNEGGLALGYQSIRARESLDPYEEWVGSSQGGDDVFAEEEIRLRSHEMLRLFSMGGDGGFGFPPQSSEEDRSRSGKAVVGWLKIKAAMRWGFFIRRKAAERRAHILDLDQE